MAQYEVMVLYDEDGSADGKSPVEVFEKIVNKLKGKITKTDDWGEKTLAYMLNKRDRGHYVVYEIELEPKVTKKLNTQLMQAKGVMRSIINRVV